MNHMPNSRSWWPACALLAGLLLAWPEYCPATHSAGADLTYTSLGGNNYLVELTFYRDCLGINAPVAIPLTYESVNCGFSLSAMAIQVQNTGQEITLPCVTAATTCNGGSFTGIQKFLYQATIALPAACTDWKFSYQICCRNCAITTLKNPCAAGSNLFVEAELNNLDAPGNNSPRFSRDPIVIICAGQPFSFNPSVTEDDGDSLYFELVTPRTGASTTATYQPLLTAQNPMLTNGPVILDPQTGQLSFTPVQAQIGVITLKVSEYRGQVLAGSVLRDMQVYTDPCSNHQPIAGGFDGTNNYTKVVLAGNTLSASIQTHDADSLQVLSASIGSQVPGAQFGIGGGSRPGVSVSWTPDATHVRETPYNFTISVRDNACPFNAELVFGYTIYVNAKTAAINVTGITCHGAQDGSATIVNVPSGASILWSNGATTAAISGLGAGQQSAIMVHQSDTTVFNAMITEPPALAPDAHATAHVSCFGGSDGIAVASSAGGTPPYSYFWDNSAATKQIKNIPAGAYTVTVSDANGCTGSATTTIHEPDSDLTVNKLTVHANCLAGSYGQVTALPSGGTSPYAFQWNQGATTQTVTGMPAGQYTVKVTDKKGCEIVESFTVSDTSLFNANITGSPDLCIGELAVLTADSVAGGSYQWYLNGQTLGGATGLQFYTPVAGAYTVTISHGCGTYNSDTLHVTSKEEVRMTLSPNVIICPGERVQLKAGGGTYYAWEPPDGLDYATLPDPIASPPKTTVYKVEVTNDDGCKAIGEVTVSVMCDSPMVPSGYSPNQDGINDGFVIEGIEAYPDNKIWIYNRWGGLIYKARNYRNDWTGYSNTGGEMAGKMVPAGTYYYILDLNNNKKPMTGYIVIRK